MATGETDVGSDLDLVVIMPSTRSGRAWRRVLYEQVPGDVAIDMLVYAEHGRVVYEKAVQ